MDTGRRLQRVLRHNEWMRKFQQHRIADKRILRLICGVLAVLEREWPTPQFSEQGEGETSCIRAALNHPEKCILLMDERLGRAVAQENGLPVARVAGLIGLAKKRGFIPSAPAVFERLLQTGFRLSPDLI